MKKRETNKGITIIVLIITIVVMFILAAVSVNLVIRGDLFNSAKGAVKKTNGKIAETETQVNELLNEWERLNAEWGDSTGGENTTPGGNTTPETCSHIWGAWNTIKAASCTEAGSRKATCTKCGETKTETLRALGHNFVNGNCTRCGAECEHTYSDWTITKEANCEEAGSKTRRCNNCGKVETDTIPAKGHNWNTATGTCKDCGTACTHTYGEWQITTEATCTAEGSKSRTCSVCKHVETESIPAKGHNWNTATGTCKDCGTTCTHTYGEWQNTTAATCTAEGSKSRTCSVCKHVETESILATGHSWNASTGKCSTCSAACTHTYGSWSTTTAATCTAEGSKSRTCSVCKHVETESIAATGHSWNASTGKCNTCGTACTHTYGEWQITTVATCTAEGSKSRTCSVCKHVETESIPATGHSWNASTGKCNTCGTACTHTYGEWQTTTAATCTVAGSKYRTCSVCKYKDVQSIAILGHNYVNGECSRCGTLSPNWPIGNYIEYNVAYTDAYKSYNYTATNGWRLLHATPNGDGTYRDVELISTGIPAKFRYYWNNAGTWWETSRLTEFKNLLGGTNYDFYNNGAECPSLKAAAGFYYNFGSLPFAQSTSEPSANNGGYTSITNSDQKSETTAGTGAGLFLTNKASGVRLLTLKELNEARGITNYPDNIGRITAAQDPTGLYYLGNLKSVPRISGTISYDAGNYWLASPWPGSNGNYVACVIYHGSVSGNGRDAMGVRPVVAISRI